MCLIVLSCDDSEHWNEYAEEFVLGPWTYYHFVARLLQMSSVRDMIETQPGQSHDLHDQAVFS